MNLSRPISTRRFLVSGAPPSGRYNHTAVWDSRRNRMVVFGGLDSRFEDDVWALSLDGDAAWTALSPAGAGPSPRRHHVAMYSPARDEMVVFGGEDASNFPLVFLPTDLWTLSFSPSVRWELVEPRDPTPAGRQDASAVYDRDSDAILVFGGGGSDTWRLSLRGRPEWALLDAGAPPDPANEDDRAVYDVLRDRMLVLAGWGANRWPGDLNPERMNDAWELSLDGNRWSKLRFLNNPLSARYGASVVLDPTRNRVITFGGAISYFGPMFSDAWTLALDDTGTVWMPLTLPNQGPTSRTLNAAIYDIRGDRMVIFGGRDSAGNWQNDTWELSLTEAPVWHLLQPSGPAPPPLFNCSAVFDYWHDSMLVSGSGQAWELSLSPPLTWRSLGYLPGASDSAYFSSEAVNDPIGQRALVEHSSTYYQGPLQTWSSLFSNPASWSPLSPAGPAPPSASYAPMYDPLRDRVLFLDRRTNSLWALNWGRPPIEAQAVALADIKRAHDRSGRGEQSLAILGSATLDVRELVPQAVVVGDTPVGNGAEFAFRDVNRDGILDLVVGSRRQFPQGRHQLGGQSVRAMMRDGRAVRGTFRFGSAGPVVGQKAGALVITSVSASGSAIRILLRSDALHDISVRLFDPAGRFIEGGSPRTGISGGATISLPLPPHVAPGIYLVTATDGHVSATSKCLVLR